MEARGILVYVLRNAALADCTNGGESSRFDRFTLVGVIEETLGELSPARPIADAPHYPTKNAPPVVAVHRHVGGTEDGGRYWTIYPADDEGRPDRAGRMFGGNFAYSSDSRFPGRYPISIYDRKE